MMFNMSPYSYGCTDEDKIDIFTNTEEETSESEDVPVEHSETETDISPDVPLEHLENVTEGVTE